MRSAERSAMGPGFRDNSMGETTTWLVVGEAHPPRCSRLART